MIHERPEREVTCAGRHPPLVNGGAPVPVLAEDLPDAEIARLRLHVQGIEHPRFERPEDVVGHLGAMQSQEYAAAKWSIGQRAEGLNEAAVDDAISTGAVLRTHLLRPTWHFVRNEDIRWMLELTAPRIRAMMATYDRKLDLDDALYARSNDAIAAAVQDGNHRTRTELSVALREAGIEATGQRLGHIVMRAELDAVICSGIPRGKQNTYAALAERAPLAKPLVRDEALGELARRYFTSHGPAALKDFRWWSGLTSADAKRAVEIASDNLDRLIIRERTYWLEASQVPAEIPRSAAHLLQGYDECIIGYSESRSVLDVAGEVRTVAGRDPFLHVLVLDGQITGHWRRLPSRDRIIIEARLLRPLKRAEQRAIKDAVERYGHFVGLPAELRRY